MANRAILWGGSWLLTLLAPVVFAQKQEASETGRATLEHALVIGSTTQQTSGSTVNADIWVQSGVKAGKLTTVNGDIVLDVGAQAREVKTVNGAVRLADRTQVEAVDTVNGPVEIGAGSVVRQRVNTVNGEVTLRGARVGSVLTVHGHVAVLDSQVEGSVESTFGDIVVGKGSVIRGKLVLHRPQGRWFDRLDERQLPRVVLEAGSKVEGVVRLERPAQFQLEPGADAPLVERAYERP